MAKSTLHVLVPLDGSPEAESVLPAILPVLRAAGAKTTLFTAVPEREDGGPYLVYLSVMAQLLAAEGLRAEFRADVGKPVNEILRHAGSGRYQLGAMTTHGRTGVRRALLGSVAEQVLRRSSVPFILNRPGTRVGDWKRILVALDGSPAAERILSDVLPLAAQMGATLHIVSVAHGSSWRDFPLVFPPEDQNRYLRRISGRAAKRGVLAIPVALEGDPETEIAGYAERIGAGLLAMTTAGRTGVDRLLMGSVAEQVLRRAPCPVLVRRAAIVPAPAYAGSRVD